MKSTIFFSRAKAEKFMGGTSWYTLSLVDILEGLIVVACDTADQHFYDKHQDRPLL